jgi:CelD/BcsL family acetyltransferase involved in cellulose biosynthesis
MFDDVKRAEVSASPQVTGPCSVARGDTQTGNACFWSRARSGLVHEGATTMRVELVKARDLGAIEEQAWESIRGTDRALASPFFSLAFARIVSCVRPTEVAVIELEQRIAGFWAFEPRRLGLAVPLAFPISEHHGPILRSELDVPAARLLRASGRRMYWFSGLPAQQRLFQSFHRRTVPSPIVLLHDFEASDQQRKLRRLAREVGEVRFEADCDDARVLERLIVWKREHAARTGTADALAAPWTSALLRELHRSRTPELRGRLSVLWAGDRPIAAHFGLVSNRVWHWWFPTYDPDYGRHSPGLLMLHAMLQAGREEGIEWLDFGPGDEEFKWRLSNDTLPLAQGTACTLAACIAIGLKRRFEDALRSTPLHAALSRAVGWHARPRSV